MVVGFFIVVALLSVVVVNASAAFLQRQELDNIADGAALAASDALSETSVYEEGLDKNAPLDLERANQIVGDYLDSTGSEVAAWTVTVDGRSVHVHLVRSIDLALKPPGWRSTTQVTADATGVLRISQ